MLEKKKATKKVVAKKAKSSDELIKEWIKASIEAKHCVGEDKSAAKKRLKEIELELRDRL
jgi:hypothetical protein|tara:strand:+ start:620 stop:799 length:180 start_codon:yes stop_codon:yes gene_type:complete